MQPKEPSRTAWGAATHRAVHQLIDGGSIFRDPFAVPILGGKTDESWRSGAHVLYAST